MLNEEKVKLMTKLAMYENVENKRYLPVSRYYRSDFIGMALIKNFFLVTIGYFLIVAGIAVYYGEYLMNNIHKMNLVALVIELIIGYIAMLAVYTVLTYIQYAVRYHNAKKSVKNYYVDLTRLSKLYEQEERKNSSRSTASRK